MPKNYYIILGVPSTSSQDQIKTAYRQLAKEYHPDRYGKGRTPFQVIQEAYSVLSDPIQRQDYDNRREQQWAPPQQKTTTEPMISPVEPEPTTSETCGSTSSVMWLSLDTYGVMVSTIPVEITSSRAYAYASEPVRIEKYSSRPIKMFA